jgi:K+-sensing histidine kinase KdpD
MARAGKLKVFLGYAAGVGKTYQMLTEAQTLRQPGRDLVIGWFEPHGRKETSRELLASNSFRAASLNTGAPSSKRWIRTR